MASNKAIATVATAPESETIMQRDADSSGQLPATGEIRILGSRASSKQQRELRDRTRALVHLHSQSKASQT